MPTLSPEPQKVQLRLSKSSGALNFLAASTLAEAVGLPPAPRAASDLLDGLGGAPRNTCLPRLDGAPRPPPMTAAPLAPRALTGWAAD